MLFFIPHFSMMFLFSPFCFKLVDFITLFTLVLVRPLGGVIFVCLLLITLFFFPFVPLGQNMGSNFHLDRDCIFNRSSDFRPRMAK
jgi:hypothetical protein